MACDVSPVAMFLMKIMLKLIVFFCTSSAAGVLVANIKYGQLVNTTRRYQLLCNFLPAFPHMMDGTSYIL